jgi:hypothetical protein
LRVLLCTVFGPHVAAVIALCTSLLCVGSVYGVGPDRAPDIPVSIERMRRDLGVLTSMNPPRNNQNVESLNKSADYILSEFRKAGCRTGEQWFNYDGKKYRNVVCSYGPDQGERVVIAAHYDVKGDQPGADDNGSGVAGLIELSRLVYTLKPLVGYRIDFLACPLEERQYAKELLRRRHMGSYTYAKSLAEAGARVRAMVSLEMIGYFSDKPGSQRYPLFFLKWFYPDKGNYIAVVGKWGQGKLVVRMTKAVSAASKVPVESITAPPFLPGIDFSDHRSFWQFGYHAVMVTDTAFYRNRNYHKATDTIDTIDFIRMAEVVKGVYHAMISL